jgi:SAM-dependent methyltransferase
MAAVAPSDRWSSGEKYEPFIGRWSRLVAREFLAWLQVPAGVRWLDVGCGTGALTDAIVRAADPAKVLGVDPSPAFVEYARQHAVDRAVAFVTGDARELPAGDRSFDAAVSGLVLNFIPDRQRAVREMQRVVAGSGIVAAYVWDYPGEMWILRHFWDAAAGLDQAAHELHEGNRFPFCRPAELEALFAGAGLTAVESRAIVVPTEFRTFDDYWTPFLGGQGPAPSYLRSLDEARRTALREAVRARLPIGPNGSVRMTARAWACRGSRTGGD